METDLNHGPTCMADLPNTALSAFTRAYEILVWLVQCGIEDAAVTLTDDGSGYFQFGIPAICLTNTEPPFTAEHLSPATQRDLTAIAQYVGSERFQFHTIPVGPGEARAAVTLHFCSALRQPRDAPR